MWTMRHLFLIIDLSQAMNEQDLKPNRLICTIKAACTFVREYFDQNPISQLGIIVTSDRRAERLTELSGNPRPHLAALQSLYSRTCAGEPSLQNALLLAESRLKYTIHHNEIVVLIASLTTCDPGDIHQTIKSLSSNRIHCSVISLAVEVFVYRALAQFTQGTFHVIMDELHLKNVLKDLVPPPVAAVEAEASLIRMVCCDYLSAFLILKHLILIVSLHLSNKSANDKNDTQPHYACPRCHAAYCELPVECNVCGLTLVAAPHLARAYHHLFPLDLFEPGYQCPKCTFIFCHSCDAILHDSIHSCPGCLTLLK
ncbi:General transcription factor IIH subunit 2 [Schistosoma japonicum]|nr:General transcription factor IIH subunit 2 [Schistosoma japonicum]